MPLSIKLYWNLYTDEGLKLEISFQILYIKVTYIYQIVSIETPTRYPIFMTSTKIFFIDIYYQ